MITKEILISISQKFKSFVNYLLLIGVLFFSLAVAILFYPQALQFLFVLAFFMFSFIAFLAATKLNHIKESFDKVLLIFPKKSKSSKKK